MNKNIRNCLLKYAAAAFAGGLAVYLCLYLQDFSAASSAAERYRILCDAFTVPGVIFIMVAALVWICKQGLFEGISYSIRWLFKSLIPFGRTKKEHETYYDYVKEKSGRKRTGGYGFIFFTGLAFFIIALVFLFLFYKSV